MQKLDVPHTKVMDYSSSALAASGATDSPSFNGGGYSTMVAYLNVTAHSGSSPTLDVKFQDSPDGGTTWYDIPSAAFTQVTTTNGTQRLVVSNFGTKLRAVATEGGTTPSYNFTLDVVGTV